MLLNAIQALPRSSRRSLTRLGTLVLISIVVLASQVGPADAKKASKVKKIKKELVALQSDLDVQEVALKRFGGRWDDLDELSEQRVEGLAGFVASRMAGAEQAYLETVILHARAAIATLEARRDETIGRLEQIVVERQARQFERSGVEAATMPSLTVGGSLITYSADWEKTAMCESTQRWHIDSRYDGGLQFDPITWIEFGGAEFARYAWQASKLEQIAVAERVLIIQGPGAWPNCFTPLQADT